MRLLFVVFSRSGHLNPMIAVAERLEQRGHEVVLFSLGDDIGSVAARAGLRARTARFTRPTAPSPAAPQRSLTLSERANNLAWAKRFNGLTLIDPVPEQVDQLAAFLELTPIDAIVVDPLAYAGAVVAERNAIPWACLVTGLQSLTIDGQRSLDAGAFDQLAPKRDNVLARLGAQLEFRSCDVVSPRANLLFAYEGLFGSAAPAGLTCVGPALPRNRGDEPAFDWSAIPDDRPLVYVSFGSQLSHPPETYQALWSSLSADEAVFVTTLKDLRDEPFVRDRPAHVVAVDYAPQLAVLERASVMVNHGGANSVMESLSRGCPMLAIPIAYDQPLLAHLVVQSGTGVRLDRHDVTAARCRDCLLPLLARDAPARDRARALAAAGEDGADRAAQLLVDL
jgi:UDP:flavonoid glycosyltransferase YjiC (YdhE family)